MKVIPETCGCALNLISTILLHNHNQFSFSYTDLPTATILSNTYSVIVGGSVTLQCTVSGNPAITSVQWSRTVNGQQQSITIGGNSRYSGGSVNSPSLVIANAANADEGYYTCSATNVVGTGTSQQTFLDITGSRWHTLIHLSIYFFLAYVISSIIIQKCLIHH